MPLNRLTLYPLTILVVQFFASAPDQKDSHEIKTESDEAGGGCKSWNLFDGGHHLGNAVENPQAGQYQCNCPDDLGAIYLLIGHRSTLCAFLLYLIGHTIGLLEP